MALVAPRIDAARVLSAMRHGRRNTRGGAHGAGQRALARMAVRAGLPPSLIPCSLLHAALASRWARNGMAQAATRWARGMFGPSVTGMDVVRALVAAHPGKARKRVTMP